MAAVPPDSASSVRPWVIDCDTHITEPRDVWTARVAKKWGDLVPHVRFDTERKEEAWFIGDTKLSPAAASANAGFGKPLPAFPKTFDEALPAAYDAKARLRVMDQERIWAQVLYPNVGGFGAQGFLKLKESELMLECVRAYNDFLVDWCSADSRRLLPIAAVPFWDVDKAPAEIERAAQKGHRGILFTGEPHTFGLPFLGDHHWDPIWRTAQELDLPVNFHIGGGDIAELLSAKRIATEGFSAAYARTSTVCFLNNGFVLSDLLSSGVLARYPKLKVVSVESGIGWIPFCLEAMDYHFERADVRAQRPEFELKPSEYFKRQVYACYWFENVSKEMLQSVGIDNILFETDFPHPTCLYGNVGERIDVGLGGVDATWRQKILWDNAAKLYHVDGPG